MANLHEVNEEETEHPRRSTAATARNKRAMAKADGEGDESMLGTAMASVIERGRTVIDTAREDPRAYAGWLTVPAVVIALRMLSSQAAPKSGRPVHVELAFRPTANVAFSLFHPASVIRSDAPSGLTKLFKGL